MTSKSYSPTYFEHIYSQIECIDKYQIELYSSIWYFSIHSIWRYIIIQLTHILTLIHVVYLQDDFPLHFYFWLFPTWHPFWGDFVMNVKQINIQSDLTSMSSLLILHHSQILSLRHFNLRPLHFQSFQSVPNWIQLPMSETSPVCTSFQWTKNKNVTCDKIRVLRD